MENHVNSIEKKAIRANAISPINVLRHLASGRTNDSEEERRISTNFLLNVVAYFSSDGIFLPRLVEVIDVHNIEIRARYAVAETIIFLCKEKDKIKETILKLRLFAMIQFISEEIETFFEKLFCTLSAA